MIKRKWVVLLLKGYCNMSEFTANREKRIEQLTQLFKGILAGNNLVELVRRNQSIINSCVPSDVVFLVDRLVLMEFPMDVLKKGINKILNLLHKTISEHPYFLPKQESYLGCLAENNRFLDLKLKALKPLIRRLNESPESKEVNSGIISAIAELEKFNQYYLVKENILFPLIEKYIPEFRCLSVMWSFHDDIKRNLKKIKEELGNPDFDLKKFNRLVGDLFFNMYAMKFREERILYPLVQDVIPEDVLNSLFAESLEIGFPFYQPENLKNIVSGKNKKHDTMDLDTGNLNVEQIKLLFNHLPVDITYVDENDKVVYFSTPKKRIFPRTKSIIGRDVHNCHPPESVHVVKKIVESFRTGKKNVASFWINMKEEKFLIQYFAIRNENGMYKGVVEVSQEISEIQNLQGEKRLLDWED